MKKLLWFLIIFPIFSDLFAKEPKNLFNIEQELIQYHNSGEYQKDQAKVINKAMLYLKDYLATIKHHDSQKKPAIVFDIDETALSNYPDMLTLNFGGTFEEINQYEGKGTDQVIPATLELYRYAKQNNVAVFFITGRYEKFREATARNLVNAGYKTWEGLFLKPENYHEKTAAFYKIATRKKIEETGYHIILNIGDQQSDLVGKHAEKTFKLPNPYYFVP